MKAKLIKLTAVAACLAAGTALAGGEFATRQEAEAMVTKAVKHIKEAGKDKAYTDFTDKNGGYIDRDLYIAVYDLEGKVRAHGQNPKMVGKEMIGIKDADGKAFVKERVDMAKAQGKFWQDYKFTDPLTKQVLPKSMYCEKLDDTAVCAGVYKR